jgi:peptide deformylase
MQALRVLAYPDPRLRRVSKPIDTEASGWLTHYTPFMNHLAEAVYQYDGVAIAAPQVAAPLRIIVVDLRPDTPSGHAMPPLPLVMINPTWEPSDASRLRVTGMEGCLSFPGVQVSVSRHAMVKASFIGKDGEPVTQEFTGLQARAIQHEVDHLNGVLLVDFVESRLRREMIERKMRRVAKKGGPRPRRQVAP